MIEVDLLAGVRSTADAGQPDVTAAGRGPEPDEVRAEGERVRGSDEGAGQAVDVVVDRCLDVQD